MFNKDYHSFFIRITYRIRIEFYFASFTECVINKWYFFIHLFSVVRQWQKRKFRHVLHHLQNWWRQRTMSNIRLNLDCNITRNISSEFQHQICHPAVIFAHHFFRIVIFALFIGRFLKDNSEQFISYRQSVS